MNELLNFILEHWKWCSLGILLVGVLILILIRRNKTSYNLLDNSLIARLIPLIIDAEEKYGAGNGSLKLSYVIEKALELYQDVPDFPLYKRQLIYLIEKILDTPERKK